MSKRNVASRDAKTPPRTGDDVSAQEAEESFLKFQTELEELLNSFNDETTKLNVVRTIASLQESMEDIAPEEPADDKSKETTE